MANSDLSRLQPGSLQLFYQPFPLTLKQSGRRTIVGMEIDLDPFTIQLETGRDSPQLR